MRTLLAIACALLGSAWVGPACADGAKPPETFRDCDECPDMVPIPAGRFEMGVPAVGASSHHTAEPAHGVSVAAFALGKTEVTRRQWRAVMGVNPIGAPTCEDCPAANVSWHAAQEFARRLSTKTGKTYRLPSEAEWEYACRAGARHRYCGGEDADTVAWYENNSGGGAQPVARKQPNAFGLYDMTGNVWEWTADCWNNGYAGAPADGSAWLTGACSSRVIRGGSWQYRSRFIGATVRSASAVDAGGPSDGLRIARTLP